MRGLGNALSQGRHEAPWPWGGRLGCGSNRFFLENKE